MNDISMYSLTMSCSTPDMFLFVLMQWRKKKTLLLLPKALWVCGPSGSWWIMEMTLMMKSHRREYTMQLDGQIDRSSCVTCFLSLPLVPSLPPPHSLPLTPSLPPPHSLPLTPSHLLTHSPPVLAQQLPPEAVF